jgi:hypothetical protein
MLLGVQNYFEIDREQLSTFFFGQIEYFPFCPDAVKVYCQSATLSMILAYLKVFEQ